MEVYFCESDALHMADAKRHTRVIIEIVLNTGLADYSPVIESRAHAIVFTNNTLKCLVDSQLDYEGDECYLRWYFNNISLPSVEKYKMELKKDHSRCKYAFILTILNVTDNDEGTYSCHMFCELGNWKNTSASIELLVYPQQTGERLFFISILGNSLLIIPSISRSVVWLPG